MTSSGWPVYWLSSVFIFADAHVVGVDLDVGSLAGDTLPTDKRLVDQDLGVRQGKALPLGAAGQQERAHRGRHADAMVDSH